MAADCRRTLAGGGDPIAARKGASISTPTFGAFADQFIEAKGQGWRNAKHRAQWQMTLEIYAAPLRRQPVDAIATEDVLGVLKPIWTEKPETASRLRGRIEAVSGRCARRWTPDGRKPGPMARPSRQAAQQARRSSRAAITRPSLTPKSPLLSRAFMSKRALAALALEFTILTAARSGEALGARWSEIEFDEKLWTVPAARMKGSREHRVPLSNRALAALAQARKLQTNDYVFPGQKRGRPLSGMSMEMLLRRMKAEGVTVHGFRSSFRDWAGDKTSFPREVAEAALAHAIGDETEAAYRRSDALAKRRKLMDAWAAYCGPKASSSIVRIEDRRKIAP